MNGPMTMKIRTVGQPKGRYSECAGVSVYSGLADNGFALGWFDIPLAYLQNMIGEGDREIKPGDLFTIEIRPHQGAPNH